MCTLPFWVGRRMLQAKMEAIVVCLFEQRKEKTTFHDKFFGFVVGVPSKFKIIFKKNILCCGLVFIHKQLCYKFI
jgi:hypothetical protein